MKIERVTVKDWLTHPALDVSADRPLVVVTGPNASGKSSLLDAIRWALLGHARGVASKDVRALIRRGAKTCSVDVSAVGAKGTIAVHRTPSGSTPGQAHVLAALGVDVDVLTAALDAGTFVDEKPYLRRTLAVRATGAALSAEALEAAGVTDADVSRAARERGLEAGLRLATERRRAAQREAEAARSPAPADRVLDFPASPRLSSIDIAAVRLTLDRIAQERDRLNAAVAAASHAAESRARAAAAYAAALDEAGGKQPDALRAQADAAEAIAVNVPRADRAALDAAVAAAAEAARRVARCEATVKESTESLWGQVRAIAVSIAEAAPRASADLAALADRAGTISPAEAGKALESARRALSKAESKVRQEQTAFGEAEDDEERARAARASAAALREKARAIDATASIVASIPGDAHALSPDVAARISALDVRARVGRSVLEDVAAYRAALAAHEAGEARARAALERAAAYVTMEEALKPDGAIASALADPRERINTLAGEIARTMGVDGVTLDAEWEITARGAPLGLLSASEAWRVRAAFAIALASVSGVRLVVLDEASICVGSSRSALVAALVAAREHYDQVWMASSRGEREPAVVLPPALAGIAQVVQIGAAPAQP